MFSHQYAQEMLSDGRFREWVKCSRSVISQIPAILYYLLDGPKRGLVREELQVVPEDNELPPHMDSIWIPLGNTLRLS